MNSLPNPEEQTTWQRSITEVHIIGMVKVHEAGMAMAKVCRKHGFSAASFFQLKAKSGWMELSNAKRLKSTEDKTTNLKI